MPYNPNATYMSSHVDQEFKRSTDIEDLAMRLELDAIKRQFEERLAKAMYLCKTGPKGKVKLQVDLKIVVTPLD